MKISKKDARIWFDFFAMLPEEDELMPQQQEIATATFSQIEATAEARCNQLRSEIPDLKSLDGRTYFVGPEEKFPQGCRSCLLGTGLTAIRKTNRCNLRCPFCYDFGQMNSQPPIGEGFWEIGGSRYREEDLDLLFRIDRKPSGVSYVYLEPFMEIEKYYGIVSRFKKEGIHQHLYTNGTLADEQNLRALGAAGLDELRFNLGASHASDRVIEDIRIAKKYIPRVGIETPMTPEFYKTFLQKKEAILATGLDFMNCAELHINPNNLENYTGENLYMHRLGYISPLWSHELTLRLMRQAAQEKWDIAVHDCCNHTKFARDMNLRAKEGGWFGANSYACEFDRPPYEAFLPVLNDTTFPFLEEEEMPTGFRPGDLVL